jgi:hypothetical protein
MTAHDLLNRLEGVRQRTSESWSAKCPAHNDRTPSLSIRETAAGVVLVHCFAGCSVAEILGAAGLSAESLFPEKSEGGRPLERRRLISAPQALECLAFEGLLIAIVARDVARGDQVDEQTAKRVAVAAGRIAALHLETSL